MEAYHCTGGKNVSKDCQNGKMSSVLGEKLLVSCP